MKSRKKILTRTIFVVFIFIFLSSAAHFILFPQHSRSLFIPFSNFKNTGQLYYRESGASRIDTLQQLVKLAEQRVSGFWGSLKSNSNLIYCDKESDFHYYGSPYNVPAATHLKWKTCIVLSTDAIDLDIIAHEISHAELYARIGYYNWTIKIPTWFDEGLAMMNDYRSYYSEDTLKLKSRNFTNLPDVTKLRTSKEFNAGSLDAVMLNFMTARHIIKNWYSKEKLNQFIVDINNGKSFDDSFKQKSL